MKTEEQVLQGLRKQHSLLSSPQILLHHIDCEMTVFMSDEAFCSLSKN